MELNEFLRRIDLRALKAGQVLVGVVLPPVRRQMPHRRTD
jgi:hypothetical protein